MDSPDGAFVNEQENARALDWFSIVCEREMFACLRIEDNRWVVMTSTHDPVRGEPLGSPMECLRLAYREALARGDVATTL